MDLIAQLRELNVSLSVAEQSSIELLAPTDKELSEAESFTSEYRRAQFINGRRNAREALHAVGFDGYAELARTNRAAPVWPEGFVGSISHSTDLIVAAAAKSSHFRSIGLDIESTNRITAPGLMERIAAQNEETLGLPALQLFSIKEACFKAARPLTEETFAFKTIVLSGNDSMTFEIKEKQQELRGQVVFGKLHDHFLAVALLPS